jgi:hypothetical protein
MSDDWRDLLRGVDLVDPPTDLRRLAEQRRSPQRRSSPSRAGAGRAGRAVLAVIGAVAVIAALALAAHSRSTRTRKPSSGDGTTQSQAATRLSAMAYAQAKSAGNTHPQYAAYVSTYRQAASRVSSGDTVDSNDAVWLVEVIGPFPHYQRFSVPAGVNPAMHCQALTFTVQKTTWQILDSGCGPKFNIAKLGSPQKLSLSRDQAVAAQVERMRIPALNYSPITDVVCHVTGALATCTGKAVSGTTVFTAAFTIQRDGTLKPVCKPSGDTTMRPIFCITTSSPPHG